MRQNTGLNWIKRYDRFKVSENFAMATRPRVALIVEMSGVYGRRILEGIAGYQRSHQPWSVFLEERELRAPPPPWLLRHHWDGIICRSTTRRLAKAFLRRQLPVVDLNDLYGGLGLPRIGSDMAAIGRLGAEHLLERGFRTFAFCGFRGETWSAMRRDGFSQVVEAAGYSCAVYESPWQGRHAPAWDKDQQHIAEWIRSLPKPLGLMACNDMRGQQVLNACHRVGASVPEEVAVLGVDNEVVLCELCDPPLSSVVPNPERIGYAAAELLDRLMAGGMQPAADQWIAPLGIATRQSTDVLCIEDADVAAAVSFIRERACSGVTVEQVIEHVAVSRSLLERRFRKYLGRSPQAEIRFIQVKRVKQLLADTDLPLDAIAELAGYVHPEYMSVVFKRSTGQTPGEYRRSIVAGNIKYLKKDTHVLNNNSESV
jgi:LacI family transcriptional regulator